MGFLLRRQDQHIKHELARRQNDIYTLTDRAIEAHTAIGIERRAAAQQMHETVQAAQKMVTAAGSHLSPEGKQAVYYRLMAFGYEVLDITNQATARIMALSRR